MRKILLIIIAYFLGSFPTGYVLGKIFYRKDIREYGSGNIGMSNVFRTFGPIPAFITLIGDAIKGYFPVWFAFYLKLSADWISYIAISAILGHVFSIYLKFKGGKGIATTFGVIFAINYLIGLCSVIVWIVTLILSRYFSLSSLVATFSSIIFSLFLKIDIRYTYLFISIFILSLITHRENIKRLINGNERKFGQKVKL